MNKVFLTGRLTRDVDTRYSQAAEPLAIARFSIAVDRNRKKTSDDQPTADFINCIAFKHTAEFIGKYFQKGSKIAIVGHIQTGSYKNKDGATVFTTDVIVDECEFADSKSSGQNAQNTQHTQTAATTPKDEFINVPDGVMEELPFV